MAAVLDEARNPGSRSDTFVGLNCHITFNKSFQQDNDHDYGNALRYCPKNNEK